MFIRSLLSPNRNSTINLEKNRKKSSRRKRISGEEAQTSDRTSKMEKNKKV
jgi:hypothetical protein